MRDTLTDVAFAVVVGLLLCVAALDYFDILVK